MTMGWRRSWSVTAALKLALVVTLALVGERGEVEGQHHNVQQLKRMVRLFQAVRNPITASTEAAKQTSAGMNAVKAQVELEVGNALVTASALASSPWNTIDKVNQAIGGNMMSGVSLKYTSAGLVSTVKEDRGFTYSPTLGETVLISRTGVYLYEFKIQTGDFKTITNYVDIIDEFGALMQPLTFWTDWEVAPHHHMLSLRKGWSLYHYPLASNSVGESLGTQINLRLISPFIPPELTYVTTAPLSACDIDPTSWDCYDTDYWVWYEAYICGGAWAYYYAGCL